MWRRHSYLLPVVAWIVLLSVNLVLLNLRRELAVTWLVSWTGGTPARADVHVWQLVNLLVGVVIFPGLATLVLWYVFRNQPVREWSFPVLLLFYLGLIAVICNLLLAQSWMLDHTDVLPDSLSLALNIGVPSLYTYGIPVLLVIVTTLWVRNHTRRISSSSTKP